MEYLAARLAAIPGVVAVALGGSRATNTAVERAGLHAVQDRLAQPEQNLSTLVSDIRVCLRLTDTVW